MLLALMNLMGSWHAKIPSHLLSWLHAHSKGGMS